MTKMIFDGHTHSRHSFDGSETIMAMCAAAVEAGVRGLTVTDHCDLGLYALPDWRESLLNSAKEVKDAQRHFEGRLTLSFGVELGQATHDMPTAAQVLALTDYDVVLGAIHNLSSTEDFYYLKPQGAEKQALLNRYFEELLQLAKTDAYDVLAHVTYAYRYMGYQEDVPPVQSFEPVLREIFTEIAQKGRALELNTSGLYRSPKARAMPDLWELKLFKACKGELVAIGSDAHRAANIGRGIKEGRELLREAGFEYQAVYRSRKPELYKLD